MYVSTLVGIQCPMNDPMTSRNRRQHLCVVVKKELTILHWWLWPFWQFQTIFLHETGNDLEWPRKSHGHLSSYFPSGESHCVRARGSRKGVSAWLTAFLGQGCPIAPATWVQLWARHCRWNKDGIDAATHRAGPWARIRGVAGSFTP